MTHGYPPIVTMTLARDVGEADLMLAAFRELSERAHLPIFVSDGGSVPPTFSSDLEQIRGVKKIPEVTRGLTAQIRRSIEAALDDPCPYILYTEPNKAWFFHNRLASFLAQGREVIAEQGSHFGVLLPARSPESYATYPRAQRLYEDATNARLSEVVSAQGDFAYGPRLISKDLLTPMLNSSHEFGWGWMSIPVVLAHRLGRSLGKAVMDLPCPEAERIESEREEAYRLLQHRQHIEAIEWALNAPLSTL